MLVQMVQIRGLLQPEKYGRGGILLMAKGPKFAPNAPGGLAGRARGPFVAPRGKGRGGGAHLVFGF